MRWLNRRSRLDAIADRLDSIDGRVDLFVAALRRATTEIADSSAPHGYREAVKVQARRSAFYVVPPD